MSRTDYLDLGDWNAVCYTCGFKFKASTLQRNWQGFYECRTCWTPRQPQDFVRAVPEVQTPPWVQPRPAAAFRDISDYIVVEAYVASDDLFADDNVFGIATETGLPLLTE